MGKVSSAASCLCCPCKCLFCGLFSCIFSILISLIVTVGVIVLVLYLLFRPHMIKATVDSAALTQFSLTANSSLQYNLTVGVSLRNPNKRIGLYYDYVEAQAWYEGQRFGFDELPQFFQDKQASTEVNPQFHGQQLLLGDIAAANFRREEGEGRFNVDVKLNAKLRLKIWVFKVPGVKPKIDCPLSLPAPGNATSTFQPTDCKVWF